MKLVDLEFHSSTDFLFKALLSYNRGIQGSTSKKELFLKICYENIEISIDYFMRHLGYHFKDNISKNNCIDRIIRRLNFIVIEGILTDEYCKRAQKYFWIEQRVIEEMSIKVFNEKSTDASTKMCKNEVVIKDLISKLERGRSIKLSEGMIANTVSCVKDFLLDLLRKPNTKEESKDSPKIK
ncbi:gamete antigen 27/25 [Plasmodium brasilianum]|uniref:Gamete antigen 27/25 (G27/25) n=2 Tax=Plasmodium (Plasmodium) TaxID=418103 RepID=A0A1A8WU04_PLAMA|nr:gamete antigen 27/25, putative [Plasmodium malariae]KAI4834584.1 gamete antigen 27/25 [Plasmodium brasilianum]SBS96444.1 gamete antigen 27/25 (G27/25) [Plasmodium malariae]SCP03121.1 gamete antigen 27/25, putative [Plasmodium malariae]